MELVGAMVYVVCPILFMIICLLGGQVALRAPSQIAQLAQEKAQLAIKEADQKKSDELALIAKKENDKKDADQKKITQEKNDKENAERERKDAEERNKPKEGSTLSGISREQIDKTYNNAEKKSKLNADNYLKSIEGQEIEWVVKVQNVDTDVFGQIYIDTKSGMYSTWINDPTRKFTKFGKGDIVKVKGKISNTVNLIGLTVNIDPESVTKI